MAKEPKRQANLKPKPDDCTCAYYSLLVMASNIAGEVRVRKHDQTCPVVLREAKEKYDKAVWDLELGDTSRQQFPLEDPVTRHVHALGIEALEREVTKAQRRLDRLEHKDHKPVKVKKTKRK